MRLWVKSTTAGQRWRICQRQGCFDGEPIGGTVAVSSVGVMASHETKKLFLAGYEEMKRRLMPTTILHYGKPIEAIASEVIELEAFQARFDRMGAK